MPCERCGSYRDECDCTRRQERQDMWRTVGLHLERVNVDAANMLYRAAYHEAMRQRAAREAGY